VRIHAHQSLTRNLKTALQTQLDRRAVGMAALRRGRPCKVLEFAHKELFDSFAANLRQEAKLPSFRKPYYQRLFLARSY